MGSITEKDKIINELIPRALREGLPKDEDGRRRWLMMNGGEKFNLRIIMEELRKKQGEDKKG